jgi:hypothetical protein
MKSINWAASVLVMIALTAAAVAFDLHWSAIMPGGTIMTGGPFTLVATVGQADAGRMSGGAFGVVGGFHAAQIAGQSGPGDCDGDGDIDLSDYGDLANCLSGPGGGFSSASCECFDFDAGGYIDLADFASFQKSFVP